jgi:hypothetical protein
MTVEPGGDDVKPSKGEEPSAATQQANTQKAKLDELLERTLTKVESGDQKAMDVLLDLFAQYPAVEDAVVRGTSDIPAAVESALLRAALPEQLLSQYAWAKRLDRMREQLATSEQSPLETALIARIVTCYLAVNLAELQAASNQNVNRAIYYEKRLNAAHHRYVSATLALARVRQLLAPVMQQLNIAEPGAQQLNVAAPEAPKRASLAAPRERPNPALT